MAETISRRVLREAVSHELKLRYRGTASAVGASSLTVVEFSDLFSEAMAPLAAYFVEAEDDNVDFRRVLDFDDVTGVITANRALPAGLANGNLVDLYFIITPVDWNSAAMDAIRKLYFTDRITIPPVSGESLYAIPEGWLQRRGQVERIVFRWTSNDRDQEIDAASYDLIEDANAVSILFGALPTEDVSSFSIIVEGRHFYEELATDAATTTCPKQLAKAQLKVDALRRVWAVMGEAEAKKMFETEMKQAQLELLDAKKLHVPQTQVSPVHVQRAQPGPEMAMTSYRW